MTIDAGARAGIYCRISDDRAGGGLGVERQRNDCLELAQRLGWEVVHTYTDNDLSAYSGRRRPAYEQLLGDIVAGRVTAILTWHQDRLNRSPVELERLIDLLQQYSIAVQTVTAGEIDLNTAAGQFVARMFGNLATYESRHRGERIRRQKLEQARLGIPSSGKYRPYGYADDKVTVVPAEAKVIREVMRRLMAGDSLSMLIRRLNKRGDFTTLGNQWKTLHLETVICSARIAGWRDTPTRRHDRPVHGTPFLAKAIWPAIVSRADVERARVLLSEPTTRPGGRKRWLLTGVARCGNCRHALVSASADTPRRRYSCQASRKTTGRCGRMSIMHRMEGDVTARLLEAVQGGLLTRLLAAGPEAFAADVKAAREADGLTYQLRNNRGVMTQTEWRLKHNAMRRASRQERCVVESMPLIDLAKLAKHPARFLKTWAAMPVRDQKALLRLVTADITVNARTYGAEACNVYVPGRVVITWRA